MNPTALPPAAGLSTPATVALVVAVVVVLYALSRWRQGRPTLADALNDALAHPEPVHKTPLEHVREKVIPKPVSDEELRAVVDAHRAGPTTWPGPSSGPLPPATGPGIAPPATSTDPLAAVTAALEGLRPKP